jgi:adenine specific DNA methylase Mod
MTKEQKFYNALQDIFIGAKIEGQGGFVNLMKIKSNYYSKIEDILKKDIEAALKSHPNFRDELFDKLYSFFNRYFTESGSIYFNSTPFHNNIYEKVYTDDKDVILFWKTQMLYYIKTDRIFKSIPVEFEGYKFYFDATNIETKKANEKRSLIYELKEVKEDKTIVFNVYYSEQGRVTKTDDILKDLKKKHINIDEETLERAFRIFEKQSEVDFFINKNAKEFLQEQFKLWSYQYFWEGAKEWTADRVNQLQILKDIAFKIIDFVSQFEDELVKIWNKPKFVKNSNYVITLDRINNLELIEKILKHQNINEQIKEWQELGILDEKFKIEDVFETDLMGKRLSEKYKHLPIDTKYFKDLEFEILSHFEDLDNSLDGWLIKSENYQALNTILPKFKEKVQTIYIDPPFNTGEDFPYLDRFQDSSWLSLMYDRVKLLLCLLNKSGTFWQHLDYNSVHLAKIFCNQIFGKENFINEVIWRKRAGAGNDSKHIANEHDNILVFSKNIEFVKLSGIERSLKLLESYEKDEKGYFSIKPLNEPSLQDSPGLHYDIQLPSGKVLEGKNHQWKVSKQTFEEMLSNDEIIFKNEKVYYKHYIDIEKSLVPSSIFTNAGMNADGTKDIKQLFGNDFYNSLKDSYGKPTIKPEKLLVQILRISQNDNGEENLILDCFLGYGTTTAVAHKLGRKWIGVEMGEHFYTVVLPRMKKVLAYDKSGISKEVKEYQGGGFFKYYELEQYEETLANTVYENHDMLVIGDKSPYEQYVFMKDEKMLRALEIDYENKKVNVDLSKLYENIDIAETLSNLTGKWIKKIKQNEVEFADGSVINTKDLDYKLIKQLIWWE